MSCLFKHKKKNCFCSNIDYLLFNILPWQRKERWQTVSVQFLRSSALPHNPLLAYVHPSSFQTQFPPVPAAWYPPPFRRRSAFSLLVTAIICSMFIVFPALIDYVWLLLFSLPETLHGDTDCAHEQLHMPQLHIYK